MIRSLWTGASGMNGQQFNIDTISNNLSNVNTTGFKKNRADFEDLLYQDIKLSDTSKTEEYIKPIPLQIGVGVKSASSQKMFTVGKLQNTEYQLDIALEGQGFLQIQDRDGSIKYTRDGSLKVDSNGQFVNHDGLRLFPAISIPENGSKQVTDIQISPEGFITTKDIYSRQRIEIGQIQTARFINPAGLTAIGSNLYQSSEASGDSIIGTPSLAGQPTIKQGFLETSNVNIVDEMVNMITAQRAYEFNSRVITTSDSLLQTAVQLKR